jgi:polyvinyl alcohol dehydrogenase (cytochrome)
VRTRRLLISAAALALAAPSAVVIDGAVQAVAKSSKGHCAAKKHAGGDWPMFGHDFSNTRTQPAEKTIGPVQAATLTKKFSVSANQAGGDGDFTGTPIVTDGCLFMGSTTGWVFATNADTGQKVWATQVDKEGGSITSSPFVGDGQVFVAVGKTGKPFVAALDEKTGKVEWTVRTDNQDGADAYGSPVVVDGVLFQGVSGGSAELSDENERYAFQGAYVLIETRGAHAGEIIKKVYTEQRPAQNAKQGGATIWSTPAIDATHHTLYVGTGNPFHPQTQSKHADAILKIDLNRGSRHFGDIIGVYDGTPEEYQPYTQKTPCFDIPGNPAPYYPQGLGACGDLDLDFGSSPNLIRQHNGPLLVGEGQKSGQYHLVNTKTMKKVWTTPVGPPSAVGGIVGSTAYDGKRIYGPVTIGGYLWALDRASGLPNWVSPVGDGAHWGNPVSEANGVVYSVGLTGFLDAYDSATGALLLHHPMAADVSPGDLAASWGGVSIARNTVYAAIGMTGLPNGSIVAYKPAIGGAASSHAAAGNSAAVGSGAAPGATVVSGPEAQEYGYLTPQMVITQGGSLQYANFDIVRHDVVQDVNADGFGYKGPKRKQPSWCKQFKKHRCPLFFSKLEGLTQTENVLGVDNLKAGTYSFYCTLHPGMKGKLTVL